MSALESFRAKVAAIRGTRRRGSSSSDASSASSSGGSFGGTSSGSGSDGGGGGEAEVAGPPVAAAGAPAAGAAPRGTAGAGAGGGEDPSEEGPPSSRDSWGSSSGSEAGSVVDGVVEPAEVAASSGEESARSFGEVAGARPVKVGKEFAKVMLENRLLKIKVQENEDRLASVSGRLAAANRERDQLVAEMGRCRAHLEEVNASLKALKRGREEREEREERRKEQRDPNMPDDVEELQTRLRQLQLLSQGLLEGERAAITELSRERQAYREDLQEIAVERVCQRYELKHMQEKALVALRSVQDEVLEATRGELSVHVDEALTDVDLADFFTSG